jgi:hypothetical protein
MKDFVGSAILVADTVSLVANSGAGVISAVRLTWIQGKGRELPKT